jgi:hypothetical protein
MERRNFFAVFGASIWPLVARAQAPQKQRRIAFVHSGIPVDQLSETAGPFWVRRFFEALRGLGYAEGRNLVVERYSAEGRADRFAVAAETVVSRNPEVIVSNSNGLVRALRTATATIPIVGMVADPVRSGLVTSLAVRRQPHRCQQRCRFRCLRQSPADPEGSNTIGDKGRLLWRRAHRGRWSDVQQVIRDAAHKLGIALIAINPPTVDEGQPRLQRHCAAATWMPSS